MNVTIRYSQACGYCSRAAKLAEKIERELHVRVDMQPGAPDQFDILIDSDVVASKAHPKFWRWLLGDAGFPDESAAIAAIKARLARSTAGEPI